MYVSTEHSFYRHLSNSSFLIMKQLESQSARSRSSTGEAAVTSTVNTVVRDAAIVYALTFAAGLCMAAAGITLENNYSTAYLYNLLSGVLGFTLVGTRLSANRAEHLAWVAATLWTFNLTNIVLELQTTSAWIHSGLTILLMASLGGSLAMILTLTSAADRRT